jgi:hypothetical protein
MRDQVANTRPFCLGSTLLTVAKATDAFAVRFYPKKQFAFSDFAGAMTRGPLFPNNINNGKLMHQNEVIH